MTKNSSSEKGKVLFIPFCTGGHINYSVALANRFLELYGNENEVYFALTVSSRSMVQVQNSDYQSQP